MAYVGGSAFAMARDLGDGYVLLNSTMMRRLSVEEVKQLIFEIERLLTTIRAEQYPIDNTGSLQVRNRKLSRLNSAVSMLKNQLSSHR
jgi:hypothetical protein